MRIAIDLSGDYVNEVIHGIMLAIERGYVLPGQIAVVGTAEAIESMKRLKKLACLDSYPCAEQIGMGEKFSFETRNKDCSIVRAMNGLKDNHFDCFLSAGNSAIITSLATVMLGRTARGIFPAIAVTMPNVFGRCLLLDVGANANSAPKDLLHNAQMGSIYAEQHLGISRPKIGLINIGEEAGKGNANVHAAHELLSKSGLNFIGYIEGRDIFLGEVDVAVTDGFTGNNILKSNEGLVKMLYGAAKEEFKKSRWSYAALPFLICALPFLLPMIMKLKKRFDYKEFGGGLLLGVNGDVEILHGRSKRKAIALAIREAAKGDKSKASKLIASEMARKHKPPEDA